MRVDTPESEATRKQLCLWIRDPSLLGELQRALRDLPGYDLATIADSAALEPHIHHGRPVVILCRETFCDLMLSSPRDFQVLVRGAYIILAMASTELRDAAGLITMADSVMFTDAGLDRVKQIVRMSEDGYFLTPKRLDVPPALTEDPAPAEALSRAERTVLLKIGEGWENQRIAELLGADAAFVGATVRRLLARLGARNRSQLALLAADDRTKKRKRRPR
jgi:DNA-binding NarL/FixJ family response regulator